VQQAFEEKANLPWEALAYVTGQINYGGRVTDAMDRRCLIATLERYYNPEILKTPNYKLSAGGAYYLPESQSFAELMEYLG
jgi:dynein heavy chain, axonemal